MDEHGSGSSGFETIEDYGDEKGDSSDDDEMIEDSNDKGKSKDKPADDGFEEVVEKKRRR